MTLQKEIENWAKDINETTQQLKHCKCLKEMQDPRRIMEVAPKTDT